MKFVGLVAFAAGISYLLAGLSPPVRAGKSATAQHCEARAIYDASTNGETALVLSANANSGGGIYVCGYIIATNSTVNVGLTYGKSGTTCGTPTKLTPAFEFAATTAGIGHITDSASNYRGMFVPPGNDLCINASAGDAVQAIVYYDQQRG